MLNLARTFEENPAIRYGITTMCIGLGMGGTVVWENAYGENNGER
jgi:acetyl-CoA acyltransferase